MIKMTKKQTDKLFESFAHDLSSKFDENCLIIHNKLFPEEGLDKVVDLAMLEQIESRLFIEFSFVFANKECKGKGKKNVAKRKAKKEVSTEKKVMSPRIKNNVRIKKA